jgi:penicillin amidase
VLFRSGDTAGVLSALENPDMRWGEKPAEARDALLLTTLSAAVAETRGLLGDHPSGWAWGRLHHGFFEHPLALSGKAAAKSWTVGPLPKGGSAPSVMHAGYRPEDFRITHGASFRMVVDLADLDSSRCINAPGQSGDPRSPHAGDLAPLWARGEYVPMLWSRAAIAEAAEHVIELTPGG